MNDALTCGERNQKAYDCPLVEVVERLQAAGLEVFSALPTIYRCATDGGRDPVGIAELVCIMYGDPVEGPWEAPIGDRQRRH